MIKPTTKLSKKLLNDESRFGFNGDGAFSHEIVNAIEARQEALRLAIADLECVLGYMEKHVAGHKISWDDVCQDIGDDIHETITKCKSAMSV